MKLNQKKKCIAVDFDGTVVEHMYPKVGQDVPHAERVLKRLVPEYNIILFTMRSGNELNEAVLWFVNKDIPLFGINVNPTQKNWTASPKAFAQIYIDDAALGCPLQDSVETSHKCVDWLIVEKMLFKE